MPALAERTHDRRKTIILKDLCDLDKPLTIKEIAKKHGWDVPLTLQLAEELQPELERLNLFDRTSLTIITAPKAVQKIDSALNHTYTEEHNILRAGEFGLDVKKALDPKLRTVQVNVQHQGNVLLTIQNATAGLLERIEANYEVIDVKIEPEPSHLNYEVNQPTITSAKAENVQPEPSNRADNV